MRGRIESEQVSRRLAVWWIVYLFLTTCVPFTTIVVARFAAFAPAIWLYAGNTVLIGAVSLWMIRLLPQAEQKDRWRERQASRAVCVLGLCAERVGPALARWP